MYWNHKLFHPFSPFSHTHTLIHLLSSTLTRTFSLTHPDTNIHPLSCPVLFCPLTAPYPKDDPAARRLARNKRRNSSLLARRHRGTRGTPQQQQQEVEEEEEDKDDDEEDDEEVEEGGRREPHNDDDDDDDDDDDNLPVHVGEAYFPLEALERGGEGLKAGGWAERLFREEDMKPHKNFAYCR